MKFAMQARTVEKVCTALGQLTPPRQLSKVAQKLGLTESAVTFIERESLRGKTFQQIADQLNSK